MQSGLAQRANGKAFDREELARELLGPNGNDGPAQRLARRIAPGNRELADDAATDAVMWALSKYVPESHQSFRGLALRTVIRRTKQRLRNHHRNEESHGGEPDHLGDSAGEHAAPVESSPPDGSLPFEIREALTKREAQAVQLFYVGRWTLAECGRKLGGLNKMKVRRLLKSAAKKIDPNRKPQVYEAGNHRLCR